MKKTILVTVFSAFILIACASPYKESENVLQLSLGFTDPHWDAAGAYLPPCSGAGGIGHKYYAIVKAIVRAKSEDEKPLLVAKGTIQMGRF